MPEWGNDPHRGRTRSSHLGSYPGSSRPKRPTAGATESSAGTVGRHRSGRLTIDRGLSTTASLTLWLGHRLRAGPRRVMGLPVPRLVSCKEDSHEGAAVTHCCSDTGRGWEDPRTDERGWSCVVIGHHIDRDCSSVPPAPQGSPVRVGKLPHCARNGRARWSGIRPFHRQSSLRRT